MTGQLRSTLQTRADDLDTWDVDLDMIVRAGDRRIRRRRVAVAGGVAAVLAVVGGVSTLAGHHDASRVQPAGGGSEPLTYAVGQVVHYGDSTVDVGVPVMSIVPLADGFVFTGPDRTVYLQRDGGLHAISHVADASAPLLASDDGQVAAWWDGEAIQTWPGYRDGSSMVVADDRTNSFAVPPSWPQDDPPHVEALSGGHLWWWNGREHWIAEVRPLTSTAGWPDTNPPGTGTVVDAADEHVLVRLDGGMAVTTANLRPTAAGEQGGWEPGGDLAGLTPQVPDVSSGDLAPDGAHWFTADGDDRDAFEVFDSASGRMQTPAYDGGHVTPYAWLDSDTIAAWTLPGGDPGSPVTLLTCRVSSDACTVAAPHIGPFGSIAISGVPIGG
ncbi:MAG TPA: hypothetical protein VFJ89_13340 [Nocardioides sp.]|jgi:hypothetical protein|nr:hypothetical protein [Nocardioides sp.]